MSALAEDTLAWVWCVVAGAELRLSDDRRVTTPRFTSCPAATTFITGLRGLACIF